MCEAFSGLDSDTPPPYKFSDSAADMAPRSKNIILFGETGSGKSSAINLIADAKISHTSPDAMPCTLQATPHSLILRWHNHPDMSVNIIDTVGLEEPGQGISGLANLISAIENAHAFITSLHASGGIDLLLFCIRAGRITVAMQRHYRLFFEILCRKQVPLAIVATHLEGEANMEGWWVRNQGAFVKYGIQSVAHACVTAAPAHLTAYASKRATSRTALVHMLYETLSNHRPAYVEPDLQSWFMDLIGMVVEFLTRGRASFKRRALEKDLETRCCFPREDAKRLAEMILKGRRGL